MNSFHPQRAALLLMLAGWLVLAGCARLPVAVDARANAAPLPPGLTWAAVPPPGTGANSDPQAEALLAQCAAMLAPALTAYGWRALPPGEACRADVLIRIDWQRLGPVIIIERYFAPMGSDFGRRFPAPFGRRYRMYETVQRAIFTRELTLEAFEAAGLNPALRAAWCGGQAPPAGAGVAAPAPPAPLVPLAPLWRVRVTSEGESPDLLRYIPRLMAVAAVAAGRNLNGQASVDKDLGVMFED